MKKKYNDLDMWVDFSASDYRKNSGMKDPYAVDYSASDYRKGKIRGGPAGYWGI